MTKGWLFALALTLAPVAQAQEAPAPAARPLPEAPPFDQNGMPFVGYTWTCKASAGEGDFALTATLLIDAEGNMFSASAQSALVAANPAQVLAPGEKSREPWVFASTLRWRLYWWTFGRDRPAGVPTFDARQADVFFELTPEGRLPEQLVLSLKRPSAASRSDHALVIGGYRLKGTGNFSIDFATLADFAGYSWVAAKWPFEGSHIALRKRAGYGMIAPGQFNRVLANLPALNAALAGMSADYRNRCEPEAAYESNEIVI